MRSAGAAAGTSPVISTQITVKAGRAYTVAGLGPAAELDLRVLDDQLDAPTGEAAVRVIEASLRTPEVSIDAANATLAGSLRFPAITGYTDLAPGKHIVSVTAPAPPLTTNSTSPRTTTTPSPWSTAPTAPRECSTSPIPRAQRSCRQAVSPPVSAAPHRGTPTLPGPCWC